MYMNIEVERLRRYLSKAELAKALSIPTQELEDWIHRRQAIPANGLRSLMRLFNGCTLEYLLKEKRRLP